MQVLTNVFFLTSAGIVSPRCSGYPIVQGRDELGRKVANEGGIVSDLESKYITIHMYPVFTLGTSFSQVAHTHLYTVLLNQLCDYISS